MQDRCSDYPNIKWFKSRCQWKGFVYFAMHTKLLIRIHVRNLNKWQPGNTPIFCLSQECSTKDRFHHQDYDNSFLWGQKMDSSQEFFNRQVQYNQQIVTTISSWTQTCCVREEIVSPNVGISIRKQCERLFLYSLHHCPTDHYNLNNKAIYARVVLTYTFICYAL